MQTLVGNRGVGELLHPSAPAVQRMDRPVSYGVALPPGWHKGEKDDESDSDESSSSSSDSEEERKRRRREKKEKKKRRKDKKEKKARKKEKKEKKEKKRSKKRRERSPSPDPRLRRNKEDLAKLVTGSYDGFVWLSAPVRRHSITEVTRDDIKGHSTFTTVTADTVATMTAYCDRINRGDFDRCRSVGRGNIEIDIDGRIFGCHDNSEREHPFLYPVAGPTCSGLAHGQLECMVMIRDEKAVTELITKWYTAGAISAAKAALALAAIVIT